METTYEKVTLRDGRTVTLATYHVQREDHVEDHPDLMIRTRTGKKVHKGSAGSSVTHCGHWLKVNGERMRVNPSQVHSANLCEHCYPVGSQEAS